MKNTKLALSTRTWFLCLRHYFAAGLEGANLIGVFDGHRGNAVQVQQHSRLTPRVVEKGVSFNLLKGTVLSSRWFQVDSQPARAPPLPTPRLRRGGVCAQKHLRRARRVLGKLSWREDNLDKGIMRVCAYPLIRLCAYPLMRSSASIGLHYITLRFLSVC